MKLFRAIFLFFVSSLEAFNASLFYQKMDEPTPQWMIEQIQNDLDPFQEELSQKFLDSLFSIEDQRFVRVRVENGNLTIEKSADADRNTITVPDEIIPHIQGLHCLKPLPDVDFIFTAHDGLPCHLKWPVFTISKCKQSRGLILFPDWYSLRGLEPEKSLVLEGNQLYPWETKKPILFFRGGDSGIIDSNHWKDSPRPRLVALSLKNPSLIDARFALGLHHKQVEPMARAEGYIGDYVLMRDHPAYKYLMDIDGNCAPAPRCQLLLHSNSVVFKSVTDSMLWFYRVLKRYKHFIPIKEDLSDLFSQLKWAKNNDGECQKISKQAQQLAADYLTQEMTYLYLYRLIEAYANKQKDFYNLNQISAEPERDRRNCESNT